MTYQDLITNGFLPLVVSVIGLILEYTIFQPANKIEESRPRVFLRSLRALLIASLTFAGLYNASLFFVSMYASHQQDFNTLAPFLSVLLTIGIVLLPPLFLTNILKPFHFRTTLYQANISVETMRAIIDPQLEGLEIPLKKEGKLDIDGLWNLFSDLRDNIGSYVVARLPDSIRLDRPFRDRLWNGLEQVWYASDRNRPYMTAKVANIIYFCYRILVFFVWFFVVVASGAFPLALALNAGTSPETNAHSNPWFAYQYSSDNLLIVATNYATVFLCLAILCIVTTWLHARLSVYEPPSSVIEGPRTAIPLRYPSSLETNPVTPVAIESRIDSATPPS